MKYLYILLLLTVTNFISSKAQTLTYLGTKEITLKDSVSEIKLKPLPKANSIASLLFKLSPHPNQEIKVVVKDLDEGSANLKKDYQYVDTAHHPIDLSEGIDVFNVDINIRTTEKKSIVFYLAVMGKAEKLYKIQLDLNAEEEKEPLANTFTPDTSKWVATIVTGGSFDFFDSPTIKNFAGDINLFIPGFTRIKNKVSLGLNVDVFNYHYYNSDSSGRLTGSDIYFKNHNDFNRKLDSAIFVRRSYSLYTRTNNNVWGLSLDPIIQLDTNSFSQIYLVIHAEALISTQTIDYSQNTLYLDTVKLSTNVTAGEYPPILLKSRTATFYDYYFGSGLIMKFKISKGLRFSANPLVGLTSVQLPPQNSLSDVYARGGIPNASRITRGFYATKFQLVTTVAPVDIAFGGEYLSIANEMHYLALYIGAALSLDKLKR